MIDPEIFTIGNFSLRWYGVIVMIGVIVGSMIAERELKRRGANGDVIWDALIWILPTGILGARFWYVMNATIGGDQRYANDPLEILRIWNGGLHIFGGFLFGAIALLWYLRKNNLDPWLFLDSAGPAMLIGQGIGRIANFINQELYGPPTTLPWGIPIEPQHRLSQFSDLNLFPFETTRFHPTFAYEMLWNFSAAGLLLWLSRRYKEELKPGTIFAGWLLLAGFGRVIIEFFRPDQPKIPGLGISYSSVFAALMAVGGAVMLMVRYRTANFSFGEDWEEEYKLPSPDVPQPVSISTTPHKVISAGKTTSVKTKPALAEKAKTKTPIRKPKKPVKPTKKSSAEQ